MPIPDNEKENQNEETGSRVLWLMARYFPQLARLMGNRYDWVKEDQQFEAKHLQRQGYLLRNRVDHYDTGMTMYDLLTKALAYEENEMQALILKHIDQLMGRLFQDHPEFEAGLYDAFEGKFGNLTSLNYLNPFGELSYLYHQIYHLQHQVIRMEAPYPNGKPKDFLVEIAPDKPRELHELVNIHCKLPAEASEDDILNDVIQKTKEKILKETKGSYQAPTEPLSFVAVLWHTNADVLRRQMSFYDRPNGSIFPEISEKYPIYGFYTYVKVGPELKFLNVYELKNY